MQFRIRRYFLLSSLTAVLLALSLSVFWYSHFSKQLLIDQETQANANMTRVLARLIWSEFADFITRETPQSPTEMLQAPEVARLDTVMADFIDGSRILKVKIYNLSGFNIYSTEHVQIGQDKSDNPGFQSAIAGKSISVLAYRNQFHSFEQTVADRHLLSTYVPLYVPGGGGAIVGVFELYSDVTEMVHTIDQTRRVIFAVALLCFALIFAGLYWVIRRGQRIITHQYQELEEAHQTIHRLAYLDSLTKLPNRNSFSDALQREIAQDKRNNSGFALLYMDLDGFKAINDQYGHAVGDLVLSETAKRLRAGVRAGDQVFRIGGDEFTALLAGVTEEARVAKIASKLIEQVSQPIDYYGQSLQVTISLGIALYPLHAEDLEHLIDLADKAMYQAKLAGSHCYRMGGQAAV